MKNTAIEGLLAREDHEGLVAMAQGRPSRVVRYLTGRLCSEDEQQKWRAVRALAALVGTTELFPSRKVADLLRRFFWSLNDESGAVPFGIPEAVGEILARRTEFQQEFLPILCSMLTHADMIQTGPIERGVIWALGRIGPPVAGCSPEAVKALKFAAWSHPEEQTREAAAEALGRIGPGEAGSG